MRPAVISGISPGFPELSRSEGQITHVLLTRSPLVYPRRGLTARLACVKHAASVRPEPGSNSPLKQTKQRKQTPTRKTLPKNPPAPTTTHTQQTSTSHHKHQTGNKQKQQTNSSTNKHTVEFSKITHTPKHQPTKASTPGQPNQPYPISTIRVQPGQRLRDTPTPSAIGVNNTPTTRARRREWPPRSGARPEGLASPLSRRRENLTRGPNRRQGGLSC